MARLRFAILKVFKLGEDQVALEYNQDIILDKLQARIRDKLIEQKKWYRKSFNEETMIAVVAEAWRQLVEEFKEDSVKIK